MNTWQRGKEREDLYCGVLGILQEIRSTLAPYAYITPDMLPRFGRNPGFLVVPVRAVSNGKYSLNPAEALVVKAILVRGPKGTSIAKVRIFPLDRSSSLLLSHLTYLIEKKYPNRILVQSLSYNQRRRGRTPSLEPLTWQKMVHDELQGSLFSFT